MTHPVEILKFALLMFALMVLVFGLSEFLVWLGCLIKTLVRLGTIEWKMSILRRRRAQRQNKP